MKNKIKYILLGLMLGLIVGAVAMAAAFYLTEGSTDVDFAAYVEDVLIPNVLTAVAAVGAMALAFKPQIDKICEAIASVIEKFKSATEDVRATAESSAESEIRSLEGLSRVAEFASAVEAVKSAVDEAKALVTEVQGSSSEIKEMLRLGFGNSDELVRKGAAKRIMKIGAAERAAPASDAGESAEDGAGEAEDGD